MKIEFKKRFNNLKPANIVIITKQSLETLNRLSGGVPGTESDAQVDQGLDPIRPEQAEVPGNDSPPVMPHQEHVVDTQMIKQTDEVADDAVGRIGRRRWRGIGVSVATEIGGDGTVSKTREREKLVAPRVPELWEPMEEQNHRSCSN